MAKIDATTNEVPGLSIQGTSIILFKGFPTIKFYPANNKSNPIDFEEDRTSEGF